MKIEPCKINLEPYENREELSRQIQEICFANGIFWGSGRDYVQHTRSKHMEINEGITTWADCPRLFKGLHSLELTPQAFIAKYSAKMFIETAELVFDPLPEDWAAVKESHIEKLKGTPIKWVEVPEPEPMYGGSDGFALITEDALKNAQMRQEDNRPESERERAYRQKNEPAPTNEPLDVEIPEVTHCDFKGRMGWRG